VLVHNGRPPIEHVHLAFPGGKSAVMRDPDGNTVELVER
jgi:catechol 2,3-dioxygenase-like lactoylglutathione lyase family enzyme